MRTIYNAAPAETDSKPMRSLNYVRNAKPADKTETKKESEAEAVWKKYKGLAAAEENDAIAEKALKEKSVDEEDGEAADKADAPAPAPATGFASILQDYKANKAQHAQMHTLSISKKSDVEKEKDSEKADTE